MALAPSSSSLPPSSTNNLAKSANARISQQMSRPTTAVDLPSLQSASRVLQEQLVKDAQAVPELGDMLTIPGMASSASYSVFPDDYRVPYQKRRLIGIPEGLFQYYNTVNVTSHMGLMPEIERVWISIDHNLFLWNYLEGEELSSFTDQPDVITHVSLVKPKPGVFIDEIAYLLVICTPVSVLLLGVSSEVTPAAHNRTRKVLKLFATDMSLSSEVEMTSVIGTPDGRIFMCGLQDGNLYEFHYQEKEGWFGKRNQLINHSVGGVSSLFPKLTASKGEDRIVSLVSDPARNCFYTLTANNSISIYRTAGDKAVQHAQTLSNLYKQAQDKAPGSPAIAPTTFGIVSLHVIEPGNTQNNPHLVAITTNGLRLYFGPSSGGYSYGYGAGPSSGGPQRTLQLMHVRLPPPNLLHPDEQSNPYAHSIPTYGAGQGNQDQPSRAYIVKGLENACYEAGLTVAAQPGDTDGTDYLLCMSPDLTKIGTLGQLHGPQTQPPPQYTATYGTPAGPSRPPLTENATLLAIPGRTWAMAPFPRPSLAAAAKSPKDSPAPVIGNELATQFSEPSRQFMVLTNVGITFLAKRRALDYLKDVIEEFQVEGNAQPLIQLRDSFGRDQTCAMLLAIASGNTFLDIGETSSWNAITTVTDDLSAVAKQAFYDFGERPTWTERVTYGTTADATGTATYSGRREGLALYFARLVRPIWKANLTKSGPAGPQAPNVSDEVLVVVQKNLQALKDLLDKNPHLFHSAPGDYTGARSATANEQEAWKAEQGSVSQLLTLLGRTIEAISFVLLLTDHHIGELISQCEPSIQKMIAGLTFEQLVTAQEGVTASRALVNVVINQQIGQQISVDTISEVLQQRCGSFCSTDDVLLYKAKENVRKAVETHNPVERQRWLGESLRLFIKGARILDFDKLREICGDYQHLNYAKGT
ncbi:hypothetical protein EIP86_007577 [Pleurotus ostreatoroseus]|nr:hypothetical protein EIP86_007577 [Pleurotus ostreatoroseus]